MNGILTTLLIINEVMAANVGEIMSPATNFDSWIEVYNPSEEPVDLGGMYLTDDIVGSDEGENTISTWKLPNDFGEVPAKGYRVIWMGSNNIKANQAPFKLNCEGGTISLYDKEWNVIDAVEYPCAMSRTSWARTTDGSDDWQWCATPTAGSTNNGATYAAERLSAPLVDKDSRLFTSPFRVKVSIPEGTRLLYTLDGSLPRVTNLGEESNPSEWVEWVKNGNCEGGDGSCMISKNGNSGGSMSTKITEGVGYEGSRGIVVSAIDNPANDWDTQFFVYTPDKVLFSGDSYRFSMMVRADKQATISVESHSTPGSYIHWQMLGGRYVVTTQWKEIVYEGIVTDEQAGSSGLQTIAFKLNVEKFANRYYFDNISWQSEMGTNGRTTYESKDGAFTISKTTNLCVRLFKDGYLPSIPITRSYIKTNDHYTLPVVSIVGDKRYFSDSVWGIDTKGTNGIPGNGQEEPCNWNMDWERPVNFSYILPDGEMAINQDVNIAVSGGWNRSSTPRSFKLKASKVFDGASSLDYVFFEQKPYVKNKALLVRNGGNDNWDNNRSRFMDPALQTIVERSGINIDLQSYQPVVEYVNGGFRGILNLREPANKKYPDTNHGYDDDDIDMFENFVFRAGDESVLNRIFELGKNINASGAYDELKTLLDIDEFTNYLAVELFLGSDDWPHNNIKAFRSRNDGRYRFILFDIDFAFNSDDPFQRLNSFTYMDFIKFFHNMLKHDGFRRRFIDTFCLMAGSVFEPERCAAIVNELADRVRPMMALDDGRSPDGAANRIKDRMPTQGERMLAAMQRYSPMNLTGKTFKQAELNVDTEGARILLNGIEVPYSTFCGKLLQPFTIEAIAPPGYQFAGWMEKTEEGDYELAARANRFEVHHGSPVNFMATFLPMTTEETASNPSAPVRINEVSAANGIYVNEHWKRTDWIELYNTTSSPIDVEGMYLSDNPRKTTKYQLTKGETDVNTTIGPHGYLIVWCDKHEQLSQLHAPFKLDADNGIVLLTAADQSWSDIITYTHHKSDETVGRYPDGNDSIYVTNLPTIAKTNHTTIYAQPVDQSTVTSVQQPHIEPSVLTMRYNNGTYQINAKDAGKVRVTITTPAGTSIADLHVRLVHGTGRMNCSDLPRGIYLITLRDDAGHVVTYKKLIDDK